jgi:Flp pilus assembly protein TadG
MRRSLYRSLYRSQHGQNLVETALVLTILLLFLAGVVDFGRAFNHYMVLENSTRVGARLAVRLPCYPGNAAQRAVYRQEIVNAVLAESAGHGIGLAAGQIAITPDPVSSGCAASSEGGVIRVSVTYPFTTIMSGFSVVGPILLIPDTEMLVYDRYQGPS